MKIGRIEIKLLPKVHKKTVDELFRTELIERLHILEKAFDLLEVHTKKDINELNNSNVQIKASMELMTKVLDTITKKTN